MVSNGRTNSTEMIFDCCVTLIVHLLKSGKSVYSTQRPTFLLHVFPLKMTIPIYVQIFHLSVIISPTNTFLFLLCTLLFSIFYFIFSKNRNISFTL